METYEITNSEIAELKQTMGFRVTDVHWDEFATSHPDGCTNVEMIELVKKWMDPPYKTEEPLDVYLEKILKASLNFSRGRS
ncbi:MAG: hypothetical protein LBR42_04280 [Candidatus Methanoplasma sp.]|jgi:hypothetical protein|nr:hypothetical protein [Candidatus Methanoplasma sp.]